MVIYPYLYRSRLWRARCVARLRAFSLLEIVLVLFVLGVLAAALVPSVRDTIERAQVEAERRSLGDLAATIETSFESDDFTNLNVAALAGTIGPADQATAFSGATSGTYGATQVGDWYAKVARLRGVTPVIGTVPASQAGLARIAYNEMGNMRLLFAGPTEAGRQRFLLISLVAPSGRLVLPGYEASAAWFDAIWNHEWENQAAGVPALWNARLTAAELAAWTGGSGGTTQAWRLRVQRIVLPKFRVSVNNNHATEAAFVSFNHVANAFTAAANSGATSTPEILGGRLVTVNRGAAWPGVEALRFHLNENPTITLQ